MDRGTASRRVTAMEERRQSILAAARRTLVTQGADSLNLRDLAQGAGVTVPTIYNLVGNKEEIFVALFSAILEEITARISAVSSGDPLVVAEALSEEAFALFSVDEQYYRAAFLAVDYVHRLKVGPPSVERLYKRGDKLLAAGVLACRNAGWLRGQIEPARLISLITHSYNENLRDWAVGITALGEFRTAALADLYITLAADAEERFHARLIDKLAALETGEPSRRKA